MIKINPAAEHEVADKLDRFHRTQAVMQEKINEALMVSAGAGARLAVILTSVLGPGVTTLASNMVYRKQDGVFIDRLVQIADLVAGGPGGRLEALLFNYGKYGSATIVLTRTTDGLELEVVLSEGATGAAVASAQAKAEIIGLGLGVDVPVRRALGSDPL